MPPEVCHINAGRSARCQESLFSVAAVRFCVIHVGYINIFCIVQHAGGTLAALLFGKTHIITLQQIDIQMETCRAFDEIFIYINAPAVFCSVTVKIFQPVQRKVEIRNRYFQMRKDGFVFIAAKNGITVIGDRDLYRYGILLCFLVSILRRDALVCLLHRHFQCVAEFLSAAARCRQHNIVFSHLRRREIEYAACKLCVLVLNRGIEAVGQGMTFGIPEYRFEIQLIESACGYRCCGRCICFYNDAGCGIRGVFPKYTGGHSPEDHYDHQQHRPKALCPCFHTFTPFVNSVIQTPDRVK